MELLKVTFIALTLAGFGFVGLYAQDAVHSSGGSASGSGGTVSYSVGQVFYESEEGAGGSVSPGIQQVYEIDVITGMEQKGIELSYSVHPNPVSDFLQLRIADSANSVYTCQLFDMSGKMLWQQNVKAEETNISMSAYSQGNYVLKIIQKKSDKSNLIKSFKIIKK